MKYRNIKNGAVIDISCILTDVDWEALEPQSVEEPQETEEKPVKEPQEEAEPKKPQKKTGKKG